MNRLFYGDNLDVLREHVASRSVDLVYLDPPFNSNRNYNVIFARRDVVSTADAAQIQAFGDTWRWTPVTEDQYRAAVAGGLPSGASDALRAFRTLLGENDAMAYLVNMAPRLVELHRVLKPTGSLYLHADPTMSHYLKVLLDATFGAEHFRNEIVWQRTAVKGDARVRLGRVHDVILCYAGPLAAFRRTSTAHSAAYVSRFKYDDGDGRGPYSEAPLDSPNPRPNLTYEFMGYPPPAKGWRVSREEMERLRADNRLIFPKRPGARIRRKNFLSEQEGVPIGDVWTDIPPINSQATERLGYPTQKPVALLERIIQMSSKPGDLVLDPFCGCGTTIDAAQRLSRQWTGIDITYLAVDLIEKRLLHTFSDSIRGTYEVSGIPRDLGSAQALFSRSPFDFERWAVSLVDGQSNEKQVGDRGVDGVVGFNVDTRGNIGRALVSVKGGRQIGPQFVRDLLGTVETQRAEMGLLILMAEPTRGMVDAADHAGTYHWPVNGQAFPRVQIMTIQQLLAGQVPKMPPAILPYIAASRRRQVAQQLSLNL